MKKLFLLFLSVGGILLSPVALASTFTSISANYHQASISDGFTYNNYYFGADALPIAPVLGTHLKSSLSFDNSVTSNFTGDVFVQQVTDWSFTSGSYTLTPDNSTLVFGVFSFNSGHLTNVFTMFSQPRTSPVWADIQIAFGAISITAKDHEVGITKSGTNGPWVSTEVAPVPEPSTYVMLLAGFAFIGFFARRKV
ncbi:PEP-CTERM sorting domain-containing protein [Methylophilus sp. DW102]|uniref:PEP-CTERM sorting domain-containing protein n=1 Tax=Methylophilus sp. DW102 TaxID=3095607 RepID=UPI003088A51A|nr:hypothetical protein MTDW_10490 [Methylophilus sp. DW102]